MKLLETSEGLYFGRLSLLEGWLRGSEKEARRLMADWGHRIATG